MGAHRVDPADADILTRSAPPGRSGVPDTVPGAGGPPTPGGPGRYRGDGFGPRPARVRQRADATTLACLYVVLLLILPSRLVLAGLSFNLTPSLLFGLGLGMWWFCAQLVSNLGAAKGRTAVRTALFLFLAANVATYGYATYSWMPSDELRNADRSFITIVGVISVGILVCDGVSSLARLDTLLRTIVVTTTVVAGIGLLQFFFGLDLAKHLALPGLHPVAPLNFILERSIFRRPAGTTGHPIEFGVVMAMVLPIAVHYAFRAMDRGEPSRRYWVAVTMIGMSAMVSLSRSAILGLIVAGLVLLPTWPARRRIRAVIVVGVFTVCMRLVVPGLVGTLLSLFTHLSDDPSVQGRTDDYALVGRLFAERPILGRGFGTLLPARYGTLDNQYLGSLVETGLVGLIALTVLLFTGMFAARAARRATTDVHLRDLAQSLVASVVVLVAGYATYDALGFDMSTALTFVLLGCIGALCRHIPRPS